MQRKLDERWVRATKERGEWWDLLLPGFGIRIGARRKTWQIAIRERGKRHPARRRIGEYPAIGLAEARTLARELMATGAPATPVAFQGLVTAFLEHGQTRKGRALRDNTLRQYRSNLAHYAASLSHRPVREITRADIAALLGSVARDSGRTTASLIRSILSRVFSYAIEIGAADANPVTATPAYAVGTRSRVLSDAEIAGLWAATSDGSAFSLIVRICLWTGCRRSEAGGMRWSELKGGIWSLSSQRTKNGKPLALPLATQTIGTIDAWPSILGRDNLFGAASSQGFSQWGTAKEQLDQRLGFDQPWGIHDLRRTCETRLASLRINKEVRSRILNHDIGELDEAYQHYDFLLEKREALQTWADTIEGIERGHN
jgi:integrase